MRSLVLAVAVTTITTAVSSMPGQAGTWNGGTAVVVCQAYPQWYPRGWELMVRPRCAFYGPYSHHAYPRYTIGPSYARYYPRAYVHHRRPYLRPGWWW